MNCNCLNDINAKLRDKNLELTGYSFIMPDFDRRVTISTRWIDRNKAPKGKRGSPPAMIASHCPFCGKPAKAST